MPKKTAWVLIALVALMGLVAGAALDRYLLSGRPPVATAAPQPDGRVSRATDPFTRIATDVDLERRLQVVMADRASSRVWIDGSTGGGSRGVFLTKDAAASCTLKDAGQGPAIMEALITSIKKFIESKSGEVWEQTVNRPGEASPVLCRRNLGYRLDRRMGYFMIYATQYNDQLNVAVYFFETEDE